MKGYLTVRREIAGTARKVLLEVLEDHELKSIKKRDIDSLIGHILAAKLPEFSALSVKKFHIEKRANTLNRIKLLNEILKSYKCEILMDKSQDPPQRMILDQYYSNMGSQVMTWFARTEQLLSEERRILKMIPSEKIAASRPELSPNAAAAEIFGVLKKYGVTAWRAARIIAEIYFKTSIEKADINKRQRSLYNKISRER